MGRKVSLILLIVQYYEDHSLATTADNSEHHPRCIWNSALCPAVSDIPSPFSQAGMGTDLGQTRLPHAISTHFCRWWCSYSPVSGIPAGRVLKLQLTPPCKHGLHFQLCSIPFWFQVDTSKQAITFSTGTKLYMQTQYIQFILQQVLIFKNTKLHLIFLILHQV